MYYRKLVKESVTLIFENSPRELKEKQFFNTYVHIGEKNAIPDWGWICFRNSISSRLTNLRKVTILKVKRKRRRIDALWRMNAI